MKTPSVKTLAVIFGDKAKEAKQFLSCENTGEIKTPAAEYLRRVSFASPKKHAIRLAALNELGGFHGREYLQTTRGEYAEYLNAGDTYAPTLIYWRGSYRVQSVGDFVEAMERQHVRFN